MAHQTNCLPSGLQVRNWFPGKFAHDGADWSLRGSIEGSRGRKSS